MLPRSNRLTADRDITRIYRKGRSSRSDLFRVQWLPSRSTTPRVAVVTSRKLSTKAVKRNLLKRQVRGIVAGLLPRLTPTDIVIQILPRLIQEATAKRRDEARKATKSLLTYDQLKSDLEKLLLNANLLRSTLS